MMTNSLIDHPVLLVNHPFLDTANLEMSHSCDSCQVVNGFVLHLKPWVGKGSLVRSQRGCSSAQASSA